MPLFVIWLDARAHENTVIKSWDLILVHINDDIGFGAQYINIEQIASVLSWKLFTRSCNCP